MKKLLLSTALGLTALSLSAQWTESKITFASPRVVWSLSQPSKNVIWASTNDTLNTRACVDVIRSIDGGNTFTALKVSSGANTSFGNIAGVSDNVAFAAMYGTTATAKQGIYKTTDGGATWVKSTDQGMFTKTNAFPNFVHFFDANNGLAMGDPTAGSTAAVEFELWTTSNGGNSWTRVDDANIPDPKAKEVGIVNLYKADGNNIWFVTSFNDAASTENIRMYKSKDKGLTWTVADLPIVAAPDGSVFDLSATNGILIPSQDGSVLPFIQYTTTDGGETWNQSEYSGDLPVQGAAFKKPGSNNEFYITGFMIVNNMVIEGTVQTTDGGKTYSTIDTTTFAYRRAHIPTVMSGSNGLEWGGGYGIGSDNKMMLKWAGSSSILTPKTTSVKVFPNPSAGDVLNISLSDFKNSTTITLINSMGQVVLEKQFNALSMASLDVKDLPAGFYTGKVTGTKTGEFRFIKQ